MPLDSGYVGNVGRRPTAGARPNYSVREDAAARGIAPERLHREGTSSHGLVGRCCAPGALVAVLRAAPVEPAPFGNWSVIVSANSCPSTIVMPSVAPAEPGFTK